MKRLKCFMIAVLCAGILMWPLIPARADILILPLRVYFKDGDRVKALTTMNNGQVQAIYRLAFDHKKQQPDGSYLNLTSALNPDYDPAQWLVYSPRQVDLLPQARQAIKISLRRPADLPDGEYRVHGVLERIARDKIEARGEGAVTGFMINVGFAVPIIIRKGKYDTTATLQSFKLLPPDPQEAKPLQWAELQVLREGKYSSVGTVDVFWTPPGGGEEIKVTKRNSLVIYPEVSLRSDRVLLDRAIAGGTVRVVYRGMEADAGIVFDEKTFPVQ